MTRRQDASRWARRRGFILERLGALRWSQQALAVRAGVSKSAISRLLSGERVPETDTLEKLAVALEVPLAVLIEPPAGPGASLDTVYRGVSNGGASALSAVDDRDAAGRDPGTGEREVRAEPSDLRGGAVGGADANEGLALVGPLPVVIYRGYALGTRDDPHDRATWDDALRASRRRALEVGTETTGLVGDPAGGAFALLVQDSSLAHVGTEAGAVGAGWTLFVNTTEPALLHTPDRVVVARSRAGELVAGFLERDPATPEDGPGGAPAGWLIVDAHRRHPVAPDGLVGAVTVVDPPRLRLTWRQERPGAPPAAPTGPAYMTAVRPRP